MTTFAMFDLPEPLTRAVERLNYTSPTQIQEESIPVALSGQDILATSQTGTGKTAAFIIPLLSHLMINTNDTAIVLTPTREIANQVYAFVKQMLNSKGSIKVALLIGGNAKHLQAEQLSRHPRLMIGTPGRINDFLKERNILKNTRFVVLDEIDRMLDMGFAPQIDDIIRHIPSPRQTLMFSATLPKNILKLSEKYLNNPKRITIGSTFTPTASVKTINLPCDTTNKFDIFTQELQNHAGQIIVFVKTKYSSERISKKLKDICESKCLHGDLRQNRREKIIQEFRDGKFKVLVGTDVAGRGIDIPKLDCVINYDLPSQPEDYIHRIGRTGRAGLKGVAVNLITNADKENWKQIERLLNGEEVVPLKKKPRQRNRVKRR